MLALIDGDIVRYRCGFASMDVPEHLAIARTRDMLDGILVETGATEYRMYLSDHLENNFRFKIDPKYKANRENQPKPLHHEAIGNYLKEQCQAVVAVGHEADDALGIAQCELQDDDEFERIHYKSMICSIDKDLLQIPGLHYNFVKKESFEQNPHDGLIHFYSQLLIGDRVDNIFGVYGLGPKKTYQILRDCADEQDMFERVRGLYMDDARLLKNGCLLWIKRTETDNWKDHFVGLGGEVPESSLQETPLEVGQSSVPISPETQRAATDGFQNLG